MSLPTYVRIETLGPELAAEAAFSLTYGSLRPHPMAGVPLSSIGGLALVRQAGEEFGAGS